MGDANLSYEERGSGNPVVMVHGIPTDLRAWKSQLNDFSDSFRAISISRRHAYPNKNDHLKVTESTVKRNSDDLMGFIDLLKLAPVHLIGHSYGGFISLYSVWKRPELFRSLVLVEPAVPSILVKNEKSSLQLLAFLFTHFGAATSARRFQNGNLKLALKAFEDNDLPRAVKYFYEGIREVPDSFDKLPDEVHSMMLENGLTVGELETEFPIFERRDAMSIKLPSLMIKTQSGPAWLKTIVDLLHQNLPNSSEVEISGSCHFPHIENSSAFNAIVLEFLKKNNSP